MTFKIVDCQGSHKFWKSWKTWKITNKSSMHGKIMEFEKKNLNNHGESWNFVKLFDKTTSTVARKLAVRHIVSVSESLFSGY